MDFAFPVVASHNEIDDPSSTASSLPSGLQVALGSSPVNFASSLPSMVSRTRIERRPKTASMGAFGFHSVPTAPGGYSTSFREPVRASHSTSSGLHVSNV